MADHPDDDRLAHAVSMLTTEHFTLQTARAATISGASGRANLFLGTVSGAVVALAFIGQVSGVGAAFDVFALVLLPTRYFLGLATYARLLQSAMEDGILARGIGRIRHLSVEVAPRTAPYFVLSTHDDPDSILRSMAIGPSRWQLFRTTAGTVAVINSVIAGVLVGLLADFTASPSLRFSAAAGAVAFVLSQLAHIRHQTAAWRRVDHALTARFPAGPGEQRSSTLEGAAGR